MKKKIIFYITVLLCLISPITIKADSGMEAGYNGGSLEGTAISSGTSSLSILGEIFKPQPGEQDYIECKIVICALCTVALYIFTVYYMTKKIQYDEDKKQKTKKVLLMTIIPTIIYILFSYFTNLSLIIYSLVLLVFVITLKIATGSKVKKQLKERLEKSKEKDKNFNEEEIGKTAFELYKDLQIAWMNFDLEKIKELVSEDIYNNYQKQLEKLKKDNQKNMMEKIEYKSNKIKDIQIVNNIEKVAYELKVTCLDYIIDNKEKVVKGSKKTKRKYTYTIIISKKLKEKNYKIIRKKLISQ